MIIVLVGGLVRGLDTVARLCYFAGRNRTFRSGLFAACVVFFGALVWARTARSEDYTVYPLPPAAIRATLINRYVQASGHLLSDGAYEVKSTAGIGGLFWQTLRFIPLSLTGSTKPLSVLDENLPANAFNPAGVTLVGKLQEGQPQQPDYFLRVMDPPSMMVYDLVTLAGMLLYALVIVGVVLNSLVRRVDYAITLPLGLGAVRTHDKAAKSEAAAGPQPFLLWFGSLGPGYGDVVLRQIPVTIRAIPAEAKLSPANHPDLWTVSIRRPRLVQLTTIATSYGALPAVRMEFEDERGITRNGVVAANQRSLITSMLDVLRFVGQ
jgi:hypothetical protein